MPTGREFSEDLKQMMFRVILFVQNEKNGPTTPLYNVNERVNAMLGISKQSILNLKKEMKELQRRYNDEEEPEESPTKTATSLSMKQPHRKQTWSSSPLRVNINVPAPLSPKKKGHSGRKGIQLSEYAEDMIRLQFHEILSKKEYPTTAKLLSYLKSNCSDFPVISETTLATYEKGMCSVN